MVPGRADEHGYVFCLETRSVKRVYQGTVRLLARSVRTSATLNMFPRRCPFLLASNRLPDVYATTTTTNHPYHFTCDCLPLRLQARFPTSPRGSRRCSNRNKSPGLLTSCGTRAGRPPRPPRPGTAPCTRRNRLGWSRRRSATAYTLESSLCRVLFFVRKSLVK